MGDNTVETKSKSLLKLEGSLSIYDAGGLMEKFMASLEGADILEIDMMEVRECDTAGIQVFCSAKKTADQKGKQIVLTGIPGAVRDAMIKTGITREMIGHDGGTGCQR